MKHHFGDLLYREGDYWTVVPNIKRFAYSADEVIANKKNVKILTISKYHKNWNQVFDCPNIEELTLHDPGKEQVQAIRKLTQIKRLRVTFFRASDIEFISNLHQIDELILEYVSGFSDLAPLRKLTKLKSLHLENLRRVSNFDGLKGINSLRYLHIGGTLDWNQPIENFSFLEGLPNLEVFTLGFIINKSDFPAFLPILKLNKLKKIHIGTASFKTKEYAFLQAAIPNVEGSSWDLFRDYGNNFVFLGKRAGFVSTKSPIAKERCNEFITAFEKMKKDSETIIKNYIR